jgi:hypothetical protein
MFKNKYIGHGFRIESRFDMVAAAGSISLARHRGIIL